MKKNRLEAFSDAVIAIIITILVLELPKPAGVEFHNLAEISEPLFIYLISFLTLVIYWNNHHHLFQISDHINGKALWLNNIILFFLSLFPFATSWIGEEITASAPQVIFAFIILFADVTWAFLLKELSKVNAHNSHFQEITNKYHKMPITIGLNVLAVILAFILPLAALFTNLVMILLWLIPDRKMEEKIIKKQS